MKSRVCGAAFCGPDLRKHERCNSNGKTALCRFDRSSLVLSYFVPLVFTAIYFRSMIRCNIKPQQVVVVARAALDSAKAADADKYAPLEYRTESGNGVFVAGGLSAFLDLFLCCRGFVNMKPLNKKGDRLWRTPMSSKSKTSMQDFIKPMVLL